MYPRTKEIPPGSGNYYAYLVSGHRDKDDNNKVKQEVEEYLGRVSSENPTETELMGFEKYREWKESEEEEKEDDLEDLRPTEIAPEGVVVFTHGENEEGESPPEKKVKKLTKFFADISDEKILERVDSIYFKGWSGGTTPVGGSTAGEYSSDKNQITLYDLGGDFDLEQKKGTLAHESAHALFHNLTDTITNEFPEDVQEKAEDLKTKKQKLMISFASDKKDELVSKIEDEGILTGDEEWKEELREASTLFEKIARENPGSVVLEEKYAKELEKKLPKWSEKGIIEEDELEEDVFGLASDFQGNITFYPEEIQEEIKNPIPFLERNMDIIPDLKEEDIKKSKEYVEEKEEIKDLIRDFAWYSFEETPISSYSENYLDRLRNRNYNTLDIDMEKKVEELEEGDYTIEKLHEYDEKPASFLDFVFNVPNVKRYINENFAVSFERLTGKTMESFREENEWVEKEVPIIKEFLKEEPEIDTGRTKERLGEEFSRLRYIEGTKTLEEQTKTKETLLKIFEKAYGTDLSEYGFFEGEN